MTALPLTSPLRSGAALLAVLCASLTLAPVATASVIGGSPAAEAGSVRPIPHVAVGPGARLAVVQTTVTSPPDRVDGVGTSRFVSASAPAATTGGGIRTGSSFDWTAAVIGSIVGLGIALLAMAARASRSRRQMALPS